MQDIEQKGCEIQHVILTRFNLRSRGRDEAFRSSKNWLANRFELFEKYCLPSMEAQTQQNFFWLVYFDIGTPSEYKERVAGYQQRMPNLIAKWVPSLIQVAEDILLLKSTASKYLLTTRLDNDDSFHQDFVAQVQAESQSYIPLSRPIVFNFPLGFIVSHGKIYEHRDESNPFTSLLEPIGSMKGQSCKPKTVWATRHNNLQRLAEIHQIDSPPMWLQVIHGGNVRNRIKGKRLFKSDVSGFVALNKIQFDAKKVDVIFENLTLGLWRALYEKSIKVWRSCFSKS